MNTSEMQAAAAAASKLTCRERDAAARKMWLTLSPAEFASYKAAVKAALAAQAAVHQATLAAKLSALPKTVREYTPAMAACAQIEREVRAEMAARTGYSSILCRKF